MMTLTREPSWRRASASGVVWSTRRPTLLTMRWAIWKRCSSSRNWICAISSLPLRFDEGLVRSVDHDVGDVRVGEQFLQRPEAEKLVDQHLLERELLAAVEVDLQLGEHLADDRAEFLGQLVLAQSRRGFRVDALEQPGKDLLLDPMDRGFEPLVLAARRLRRRGLAVGQPRHGVGAPVARGRREAVRIGVRKADRVERRKLVAALGGRRRGRAAAEALHRPCDTEAGPPAARAAISRSPSKSTHCAQILTGEAIPLGVVNKAETLTIA